MSNFVDWYEGEYYYRPFDPNALIGVLQQTMDKFPGCSVGRAGNGIGNLCVYNREGEYVGVIDLHDPPEGEYHKERFTK
jgi:hypothetical protein